MNSDTLILDEVRERTSQDNNLHACTDHPDHRHHLLAIRDAMSVLGGKWKIQLVGTLSLKGKHRFKDLQREVEGIGAKMLSKELQELEANQLITRTVMRTRPITVEYEITSYGRTLQKVINEIMVWGLAHREKIMKSDL